jgi:hypothetical protein
MTNNTTTKVNNMINTKLTIEETEHMTLEEFAKALRDGKIEVRKEFSHNPTADEVTMNGKFGCE